VYGIKGYTVNSSRVHTGGSVHSGDARLSWTPRQPCREAANLPAHTTGLRATLYSLYYAGASLYQPLRLYVTVAPSVSVSSSRQQLRGVMGQHTGALDRGSLLRRWRAAALVGVRGCRALRARGEPARLDATAARLGLTRLHTCRRRSVHLCLGGSHQVLENLACVKVLVSRLRVQVERQQRHEGGAGQVAAVHVTHSIDCPRCDTHTGETAT
jgi:hypothetical protein